MSTNHSGLSDIEIFSHYNLFYEVIFVILVCSKYTLLINNIAIVSVGMEVGRPYGYVTEDNRRQLSIHLQRVGEGMSVRGSKMFFPDSLT